MLQIVSKKHWATHELQGTDVFNEQRSWYLQRKKRALSEWKKKKIWMSILGRKTSLRKTCSLFRQEYSEYCRHGGGYSANSFCTCIGQQIQMDTLWLKSS